MIYNEIDRGIKRVEVVGLTGRPRFCEWLRDENYNAGDL